MLYLWHICTLLPAHCRTSASSFEVGGWSVRLGCEAAYPLHKACKFFTKGVRNHSYGVFVNQYVGHACRRRPYCRRTCLHEHCNFASGNVSGVPHLQFASTWEVVKKTTPSFLISVKIASSVSTVLTTTMLTWIELSEVHMYLGLKISPFFFWRGAKKWGGHGHPGRPDGAGPALYKHSSTLL